MLKIDISKDIYFSIIKLSMRKLNLITKLFKFVNADENSFSK